MKHIKMGLFLLIWAAVLCTGCHREASPPQTTPAVSTPAPTTPVPTTRAELPFSLDVAAGEPITVWEDSFRISGTADPEQVLTVGGFPVEVSADGSFSVDVPLEMGKQTVEVVYKGEKTAYAVERRYNLQSFAPHGDREYCAGQTMFLQVFAREGSRVEAFFQGNEVAMKAAVNQLGSGAWEGFLLYTGQVDMPIDYVSPGELGTVTYRITCDGITEEFESGTISCGAFQEALTSDPTVTPQGYWDVGSGFIVELIGGNVETFSGRDNNDLSRPTNNYLPAGTVDYGSTRLIHNREEGRTYRALRCGIRVYAQTKNDASGHQFDSVDCYYGTLPDHNEIGIASLAVEGHHTYLTLDCLWKAPFYFDFEPQDYRNEASRSYYVEKFDARYIDITFCYATQVTGLPEIGDDHPLFKSAEIIQNEADITLRLWLKKEGGFYGWDSYYNENDQLVFRFLNPVTVTKASNPYGADLTGVTILLDVGHGGIDMGAAGHEPNGRTWPEGELNLRLAQMVKAELETTGATVILNRTDNEMQITHGERIAHLQATAPDYCLCIHHNSSHYLTARGHETGFFTTFSQRPSELVTEVVKDSRIYAGVRLRFYLYYFARQTTCPVVLTESGYLSNQDDLEDILSEEVNQQKAKVLTQGVVNYFLEMNGLTVSKG